MVSGLWREGWTVLGGIRWFVVYVRIVTENLGCGGAGDRSEMGVMRALWGWASSGDFSGEGWLMDGSVRWFLGRG